MTRTTRLIKCQCGTCAYSIRTTRKWITELGPPICPCNREVMEIADASEADYQSSCVEAVEAYEADALRAVYRVLSDKWQTARAPHVCGKCHGPIAIGEEYHRLTYTLDGHLETMLGCLACVCRMTPASTSSRRAVARA